MFQTDWLSVCVTHQPFEYYDPRTLLRGRGTSIKEIKLNESNKEVKYKKKKEHMWTRTQDLLVVNSLPKPLDKSVVQCRCFIICISTCKILVKLTVNTESRRKVKISCALTVKLCTCVRLIKSDNKISWQHCFICFIFPSHMLNNQGVRFLKIDLAQLSSQKRLDFRNS